jgi:transposase
MVTLSQEQLQRIKVIEKAVEGHVTVAQAAELLNLSARQVKRLKKRYESNNAAWVQHGNRGRPPVHRIADATRRQVVALAKGKYAGFNDSHLQEKLASQENLKVSRPTLQRILRQAGRASPQKRRSSRYRSRRPRREQEGAMLQTDGSRHDWLEGRGPDLTLLGFIDDATGKVPVARFQEEAEDAVGYLRLLRIQVEQIGVPLSLYRDQHGIFQRNDDHWSLEEQLQGEQSPTQVGRALRELGISSIPARSPQAKGRIERLWRTFQDRLCSELRLAGAATLEQANQILQRFLVEYNASFARPAPRAQSAYRKLDRRLDLNYIFSLRYERKVNPDHTVVAPGVLLQLPPLSSGRGFAGKKVEICQQPNGDWRIYLERRLLHVQPAAPNAPAPRVLKVKHRRAKPKRKPPRIYSYAGHEAKALAV